MILDPVDARGWRYHAPAGGLKTILVANYPTEFHIRRSPTR